MSIDICSGCSRTFIVGTHKKLTDTCDNARCPLMTHNLPECETPTPMTDAYLIGSIKTLCRNRDKQSSIEAEALLDILLARLDELRQARERLDECAWKEDWEGQWESGCGQYFGFNDGGPEENHFKFCHGCGHPVKPIKYVEPPIEDEEAALPTPPASGEE